jgi:hypothetical protein
MEPYDAADDGFVRCEVEVFAAPFRGVVRAEFWAVQLVQFHSDLERMQRELTGRAELTGMEDCHLVIDMAATGRALVTGVIGSIGEQCLRLSFNFDTDQTYLAESLRDFRAALISSGIEMPDQPGR